MTPLSGVKRIGRGAERQEANAGQGDHPLPVQVGETPVIPRSRLNASRFVRQMFCWVREADFRGLNALQ